MVSKRKGEPDSEFKERSNSYNRKKYQEKKIREPIIITEKICPLCNKKFIPDKRHPSQKTCSNECSKRIYQINNKEKIYEKHKEYIKNNKEQIKISSKKSKDKIIEEYGMSSSTLDKYILRDKIFNLLGNQCSDPYSQHKEPFIDGRCLFIDHVNGNGCKDRREGSMDKRLRRILKEIKAGSKDYQLLCANCNWIKRIENCEGETKYNQWRKIQKAGYVDER